jgi:CheY-like chemotaxis protein
MYMSPGKKPVILLIEADLSLRRLISLGLQNRGIHVIEASSPTTLSPLDLQQLDLLVLDIDSGARKHQSLPETFRQHPQFSMLPTVVLAWESLSLDEAASSSVVTATASQVISLPKPFDARKLYQAVERLLQVRAERVAAEEARAEALLLATYNTTHTAPSPWPVVTAAGLLLVVVGMLLQIAVAAVGFLIVIISLLLWTLGAKSPAESRTASVGA